MDANDRRLVMDRLRPYIERARSFSGWRFAEFNVRPLEARPPWDYESLVREYARAAVPIRVRQYLQKLGDVPERVAAA
jgi:hypothetical protein